MNTLLKAFFLLSSILLSLISIQSKPNKKHKTINYNSTVQADSLSIKGILKSVEESKVEGMFNLKVYVNDTLKDFKYKNSNKWNFETVRNLIGKNIFIQFKAEVNFEEIDFHYEGTSIYGNYNKLTSDQYFSDSIVNSIIKVEGILKLTETNISGDLNNGFEILKDNGDTIYITSFINDQISKYNEKKVTVYYVKNQSFVAEKISFKTANIIGKYYNENCNLTISIFKLKEQYYYEYKSNLENLKGKAIRDGKWVVLSEIDYAEDYFDINLDLEDVRRKKFEELKKIGKRTTGVFCELSSEGLTIQNYGNAMNHYVKLSGCDQKYIHFKKQ